MDYVGELLTDWLPWGPEWGRRGRAGFLFLLHPCLIPESLGACALPEATAPTGGPLRGSRSHGAPGTQLPVLVLSSHRC